MFVVAQQNDQVALSVSRNAAAHGDVDVVCNGLLDLGINADDARCRRPVAIHGADLRWRSQAAHKAIADPHAPHPVRDAAYVVRQDGEVLGDGASVDAKDRSHHAPISCNRRAKGARLCMMF